MINELAYQHGQREAFMKFALAGGQTFGVVKPPALTGTAPTPATMPQTAPKAPSASSAPAAPTAPTGAPAASSVSPAPGLGLQTGAVTSTGAAPPTSTAGIAGQTALQTAAGVVQSHGSGK